MASEVLLFTFANDRDSYLETLSYESKSIGKALASYEDSGGLYVKREENVDTSILLELINRYDGEILIFHYAGHANGDGIKLLDGLGHAEGLAELLARQKKLKLVFLNGCSTQGQVDMLLGLGIKAVISTSTSIEDFKASEFAANFYKKLANRGTIKQSFEFAKSSLSFIGNHDLLKFEIRSVPKNRDLVFLMEDDSKTLAMPWSLVFQEDDPNILDWTLPSKTNFTKTEQDYEPNEYIYPVLYEMANNCPQLALEIENLEDERENLDLIIKNFPWNIGAQISILVSTDDAMSKPNPHRIEQVISAYIACSQFLYYCLLSQVWDNQTKGASSEVKYQMTNSLALFKSNVCHFDYFNSFIKLMGGMNFQTKDLFIPQFYDIYNDMLSDSPLFNAHLYLEAIRGQLNNKKTIRWEAELTTICAEAEYALSIFLSKLAFLACYTMVTVRDIYFFNPRHKPATYQHQMGRVSAHSKDRVLMFRDLKALTRSLDSSSIVLLRDLNKPEERLNLTPFYIDKNAYTNRNASATDLYTFAFRNANASKGITAHYFYIKSSHNFFRAIEEELDQIDTDKEVYKDTGRAKQHSRFKDWGQNIKIKPYYSLKEQFDYLKTIWS